AGHDDGESFERARNRLIDLVGHSDSGGAPFLDDPAVPILGKPFGDCRRDGRTDTTDISQFLCGGGGALIQRVEMPRQRPRRRRPDVPDRKRHEDAPQWLALCLLELLDEIGCSFSGSPALGEEVWDLLPLPCELALDSLLAPHLHALKVLERE